MILLTLSRGKGEETVRLQLPPARLAIAETGSIFNFHARYSTRRYQLP